MVLHDTTPHKDRELSVINLIVEGHSNVGSCDMSNILRAYIRIALCCIEKTIREEDGEKNLKKYCMVFVLDFFSCVVWDVYIEF
jgi:hypothetical protein